MHEVARIRAFPCATRIPVGDEAEGPFTAVSDDRLQEVTEVLRVEAIGRIAGTMAALDPYKVTFGECRELFKLLRSFRRGEDA